MLTDEEKRILNKAERIRRKIREENKESRSGFFEKTESDDGRSFYAQPTGNMSEEELEQFREKQIRLYEERKRRELLSHREQYSSEETEDARLSDAFTETKQEHPVKKKHHFFRNLFLLLLLFTAALTVTVYLFAKQTEQQPLEAFTEDPSWALPPAGYKGVTNILLLGTDNRAHDNDCRSDAIIVASFCPRQHKICFTSILRDSYTAIPGIGLNRINHAYQMGGPTLLIETIEQNFHIRIDHYMKVDFYSFIDIVDALGGVEISVEPAEVHYVDAYLCEINQLMGLEPADSFIDFHGTYNFNGRQALAYARIRYIGTDFGRTERQRTVIGAAIKKIKKKPWTILKAGSTVCQNLTTDMTPLELTGLFFKAAGSAWFDINTEHVPVDGLWWNDYTPEGQEVLNMDFNATSNYLRTMIYGE